ncbi:uncharacterized protein SPAPADRAFT_51269 [Spathaspora passalidarum NRRL Y-27907]|uniref:candidapepsin n=1 Tax=Spathaspora passalidarum (strain NRRL Y-27907 / 11-Y1) TaxID=619300 RepID=G3AR65_SPAPN|nr:uncharacterized protein SPAPADRAFT_51269 [Spathaspora passalidarum NRRL Y-27907]EGW31240.1 hypothetical protein SPAPADRAFT_51269 [Spathaspora passalidarum NRRL Y-27907]
MRKKMNLMQVGIRISISIVLVLLVQAVFIDRPEFRKIFGEDTLVRNVLEAIHPKRDDSKYLELTLKLSADRSLYTAAIQLGSNKDEVNLLVDTGSADTLVISSDAKCYIDNRVYNAFNSCFDMGTYDLTRSTTASGRIQDFNARFFDGHYSSGMVIKDAVHLSDSKVIDGFEFGIVNSTTTSNGILGISRTTQSNVASGYSNFPCALKKAGLINKLAYSIFLNNSDEGNILFGAIDKAKYYGKLVFLPFASSKFSSVTVTSINFGNGNSVKVNQAFLIDSGTTFINVNAAIYNDILNNFEGERTSNNKLVVDCNQPADRFYTFKFPGVSIKVPFTDLVTRAYDSTTGQFMDDCLLAVTQNPTMLILGANFMRHAYLAFDLERKRIGIAQANYTSESNIVSFP